MAQATEPCPADRWGDARTCWRCEGDIPIGSPAARNEYGVYGHAGLCPSPTDSKAAAVAAAGPAPAAQSEPATADLDLIDMVALAMDDELPEPALPAAAVRDAALRASFGPLIDAWEARGVTPPAIAELLKSPTGSSADQPSVDLVDLCAEAMEL